MVTGFFKNIFYGGGNLLDTMKWRKEWVNSGGFGCIDGSGGFFFFFFWVVARFFKLFKLFFMKRKRERELVKLLF